MINVLAYKKLQLQWKFTDTAAHVLTSLLLGVFLICDTHQLISDT